MSPSFLGLLIVLLSFSVVDLIGGRGLSYSSGFFRLVLDWRYFVTWLAYDIDLRIQCPVVMPHSGVHSDMLQKALLFQEEVRSTIDHMLSPYVFVC